MEVISSINSPSPPTPGRHRVKLALLPPHLDALLLYFIMLSSVAVTRLPIKLRDP